MPESDARVAIVDLGMGNLHNVRRACAHVGIESALTTQPADILAADAVILPGVGAMPEAMRALESTGLGDAVRRTVADGKPLLGVCLGLQLLMSRGTEFNEHDGLGIFRGSVERFPRKTADGQRLRVPHIGWAPIFPVSSDGWQGTLLATTPVDSALYFVHSYRVIPEDNGIITAKARYAGIEFVAAVSSENVFACQFHPERSGPIGLRVYQQFAARLGRTVVETGI
ncbi:MAG TPA: imidazole glycerol phosphate synthase subunit HisH [Gemmatimonadaceae bacterium]|nr:imidazole glycerol phosphate synthase subunit HisH [Gemmatimonadaceae bacterium]